ncbi:hypothetical protein NW765_005707 [Fusarium oxysporum]|nr:hypothetical protein NW765_005707 [Fusarium oxysporum]
MYECMFKPCPYKSKREKNCKQHMEKAHGWTYIRTRKNDRRLPSISDMGLDMTIKQPRTPLDAHSADEPTDAPIRQGPDVEPEYSYSITESPEADILHLNHKKSLYTFEFPLHDIRDGKLRVSKIRELAAGMTYVPKSLRHLVELSCKETKLLIDVESPQFREPDPMDSLSCPSFLVNGYCMDRDDCPFIHDAAMTSTSDSSSKLPDGLKPFKDPGLTMNRKELKVWKALCALEDELEVGWLPICREAINSDDGSTKNKQERLGLINGIHSNILGKLRRIEELSKPDIKAKRSYIVEKVNKLLAELGVTGGSR